MCLARIRAFFYAIWFLLSVVWVVVAMSLSKKTQCKSRRIWAKAQRFFIRYEIEVEGEFDPQAQMVIMNHQSILDIVVLEEIYPANICWIAKKQIADLPVIGKIITLPKMIQVDRENPRDLVRIVREVKERVSEGRVIAMFPEGTRRRGDKLLKFQSGAKAIVSKLGLKVQPVVLVGTKEILNSHEFTLKKGDIKIVCLDPIDTSDPNWLENARELMQNTLDQNTKR